MPLRATKHRDRCNKTDRSQPSWRECYTSSSPMKIPFSLADGRQVFNRITRSTRRRFGNQTCAHYGRLSPDTPPDAQRRQYLRRCQVATICERCSPSPFTWCPAPTPAVIPLSQFACPIALALIFDSSGAPYISVALLQPFIVSCPSPGNDEGKTWGQAATVPGDALSPSHMGGCE